MAKNWHCVNCNTLVWNRFARCKSCSHKNNTNQKGLFGKDNPNWQGGIAKNPYTFRFKRLRSTIHDRYQVCQYCYQKNDLVVHHLNHDRSDNSVFNLITLCRVCNSREQHSIPYYQNFLGYKLLLKFQEEVIHER